MSDPTSEYIISGGSEGKNRLGILAEVMFEHTKTLLTLHGLKLGIKFLDNGCGGGNVALMAAEIIGSAGSVTALDFDKKILELARQDAMAANVKNVSFAAVNAYDIAYDGEFDMAYARFLLSHLKNPLDALLKMKQSVKPGGKIVIEDVQFSGHFCYPVNPAFDQFVDYYTIAARHNGADSNIGPSVVALFHIAGIEDVGFDVIQPCFDSGPGKWMAYVTFNNIKNTLLSHGIANQETIAHILRELEDLTNDERSIISLPRIFRVWGIKR